MVQCSQVTQKGSQCSREALPGQTVCAQHKVSSPSSKTQPILSGVTLFLMHQSPGIPIEQINDVWRYANHLRLQYDNMVAVNELKEVVQRNPDQLTGIKVYHAPQSFSFAHPDPQIIQLLAQWLQLTDLEQIEWNMKAQLMLQAHLFG